MKAKEDSKREEGGPNAVWKRSALTAGSGVAIALSFQDVIM